MPDPKTTEDERPTAPAPDNQNADDLEKVQEDAAHERENEDGYQ